MPWVMAHGPGAGILGQVWIFEKAPAMGGASQLSLRGVRKGLMREVALFRRPRQSKWWFFGAMSSAPWLLFSRQRELRPGKGKGP